MDGLELHLGMDESKMEDVDLMLNLVESNDYLLLANRKLKEENVNLKKQIAEAEKRISGILDTTREQITRRAI